MSRLARIVIPGLPHHITQRGNNRQDVFFVDEDKQQYLRILHEQSAEYDFSVLGYCLMTNHVHIIGAPGREESLARAVGRTNYLYTLYVNRMHGRSGHLWQNRFYSCGLDDHHFWLALRYVEQNPVRAKMVRVPWRYEFSSAAVHVGETNKNEIIDIKAWEKLSHGLNWKEILKQNLESEVSENFRNNYRRGRPLGSDNFISKLETLLNRRLRPLPVGRPKKSKK
ncbi:MAG: transposase [Phycisphaerae bacterium]|nr:transposase [Phycisphaerae bacterium]